MNKFLLFVVFILSLSLFAACNMTPLENSNEHPYQQYMDAYQQLWEVDSFAMEISQTSTSSAESVDTPGFVSEATIQLVHGNSGDMAITHVVIDKMADDPIIGTSYIRDGWLYQTASNLEENFRSKQGEDFAMNTVINGFIDFTEDVIAKQSAKDTFKGRLLTFELDSEKYYEYIHASHYPAYGERSSYSEPPVYTVLLDQQGRIKQITWHVCEIHSDSTPLAGEYSYTVTFTQYGGVELDFPELNDEDYPEDKDFPKLYDEDYSEVEGMNEYAEDIEKGE